MACPREILDAFELVIDIFFSGVEHRERAAFILCDNLIEMTCKTRAIQEKHDYKERSFHKHLEADGVEPNIGSLAAQLLRYHDTRNNMQHANVALTVNTQHCADAILDTVSLIEKLWPGTDIRNIRPRLKIALRIIFHLYSSNAIRGNRRAFEDKMSRHRWRGEKKEGVKADSIQINPGQTEHWSYVLVHRVTEVERLLDESSIPAV